MFEEGVLTTFWDHIDELRKAILRALVVIGIGFIGTLFFYESLVQMITPTSNSNDPLIKETLQLERVYNQTGKTVLFQLPHKAQIANPTIKAINQNLFEIPPKHSLDYLISTPDSKLILLSPIEGMLQVFKLSFWTSLAVTSPIWILILLNFISPGLRTHEKWILLPFIFCSLIVMFLAILIAQSGTIPIANHYLETFNSSIGQNFWSFTHYVDYVLVVICGHIIAAELCLVLVFGVHFQLITAEWLVSKRRYMIVLAFVLGAALTPPDVITQLMMAIPLVVIYEIAILYGKIRQKKGFSKEKPKMDPIMLTRN